MANLHGTAQKELQRLVDQIERLQADQKALGADVSDKLKEAKDKGFDAKIIRKILKLRKMSDVERKEEETLIDVYLHALGMAGTPLGEYADRQLEAAE